MPTVPNSPDRRKVTVPDLASFRDEGRRIAMITAYDATFARLSTAPAST
jgi:ketopantoate hydroxymethyltransferase